MTTSPLLRADAPSGQMGPPHEHSAGPAPTRPALLGSYTGYVGYFVGAGLISGAVVHYPLDPARYGAIGAAGVAVFLTATVLNEFILPRSRPGAITLLRVVGASLLLSLGIGMVSGGLQHFADVPTRSAVLVPAGLLLSFTAYVLRHATQRWKAIVGPIGLTVLTVSVLTFTGLSYLAKHSTPTGHSHGAEHGGPAGPEEASDGHHTEGGVEHAQPPATSGSQPPAPTGAQASAAPAPTRSSRQAPSTHKAGSDHHADDDHHHADDDHH
ncbi:hypothetical protein EV385_5073 [Krasilnikovia cinnamomea]|uniref:Uncharacterized protein n=1 Tax=Krasilnikovia cinnamomea TaxID=349313 RepID=A0A4Q7ZQW6_9ACTN|nr:hypothetical protein [Krasilnikovia cinnamomea]RZU53184.1 hypothetical protein EV385_5073 [Krasilnikovia cinnamomea]